LAVEEVVVELTVAAPHVAGHVQADRAVVEAGGQARAAVAVLTPFEPQRAPLPRAGEHLDHAAQGIAAIEGAERTADYLDALDSVDGDELPVDAAEVGVVELDAVPQQQGLVGFGPAQEERGL